MVKANISSGFGLKASGTQDHDTGSLIDDVVEIPQLEANTCFAGWGSNPKSQLNTPANGMAVFLLKQ